VWLERFQGFWNHLTPWLTELARGKRSAAPLDSVTIGTPPAGDNENENGTRTEQERQRERQQQGDQMTDIVSQLNAIYRKVEQLPPPLEPRRARQRSHDAATTRQLTTFGTP
jgi:hypothetical protein